MAISVVGQGSAATTSVAVPAHQAGDLILIAARGGATTPTVPAAGGTVPAWVTLQAGVANSISLTVVAFVATAANHTSGVFANTTQIAVIVLRGAVGQVLQTAAARSSLGNGNNTQTIVYPALTFTDLDGSSFGVRVGTRGVAATAVATAPSGWTNRVVQPAGASALLAVHTRAAVVASPAADSVATTGTNAAYRAVTVEVLEVLALQSVTVGGVPSAQAFGTSAVSAGPPPAPQTVQARGLPPPGFDFHIAAEYKAGQAKVGWTGGVLFGTPTVGAVVTTNVLVAGLGSAQAFGSLTIRTTVRPSVGGVPSAQQFGVVTPQPGAVARTLAGLGSAQAFGTVTSRTAVNRAVGAVSSAQAFGAVTIKTTSFRAVGGVGSAQQFGTVVIRTATNRLVNGVATAQAFGTITVKAIIARAVTGVSSSQQFGAATIRQSSFVTVAGVATAQAFGTLVFRTGFSVTIAGVPSAQGFGTPTLRRVTAVPIGGVPSAQWFGTPAFGLTVTVAVPGVASAQTFGSPWVYLTWVYPTPGREEVSLDEAACLEVALTGTECLVERPAICGMFKCGEKVCGGIRYIYPVSAGYEVGFASATPITLDLEPVEAI